MKYQQIYPFLFLAISFIVCPLAQENKPLKVSELFMSQDILPIELSYSIKYLKKNTNDSTYIQAELSYIDSSALKKTIPVELRARGKYRRRNCYFTPLKLKVKKADAKETLFEGNKKLKMVLPCLKQNSANDNVVEEWLAYKLYEEISPYHFKTRLVSINFNEIKNKKNQNHQLKGILIEDDKKLASRHGAKLVKSSIHPMGQDGITSVQNAFFQYMIGNTDYSTAKQHNEKLMYIEKKIIPVPYDFDMCGLVDASYAVVSQISSTPLDIKNVRERMYRGFKRDENILYQVRKEFLENKATFFNIINDFEPYFDHKDNLS
ncbi:MAG: hypothetical protein HKN90_04880, partial [Flavobacteriaceae bacterium]|nr:hypothetical protein [Flavobacteriaceae bacterium]